MDPQAQTSPKGISQWVSIGWASGTLGSSTLLGAMSLLILFYLTEYLGLSPALAGILIFVSRLWDIAASLLVGQWSDQTSSRWGRRVPFLLVGAPLSAIAYFLLFAAPEGLTGTALVVYVQMVLLLFATGYTLFVVPYLTVPAEITEIPQQRTTMMSYRVAFMTLASVNVAAVGPALIEVFGGGRSGYVGMGAVQALIILVAMLLCTMIIARNPAVRSSPASTESVITQLRMVWQNRPFKIFIGVKFFQLMGTATVGASLLYLARYILGVGEEFLIRFVIFSIVGTMISLPAWTWIAKRYGKRLTYMGAGFLYAAIAFSWTLTLIGEPDWVTNFRLFMIGVGSAGLLVMGFSILPDTMEHNTKTQGVAQEGTMAAFYSMIEKGTAAFGPLVAGFLLEASGFISAAGGELPPEQPQSALIAIIILASVFPAICNVAGSLLLTRFDLQEEKAAS